MNLYWFTLILIFRLLSDASQNAIGAVIGLIRTDNTNKFMLVMYASRHLTDIETRYSTREREL